MAKVKIVYKAAENNGVIGTDEAAQKVGEFLTKTFGEAAFKSEDVVEIAKPTTSPIHEYFDWDDALAAKRWRTTQAAQLIRSILVVEIRGDQEIASRGFHYVSVRDDAGTVERRFVPQTIVWKNPELSMQVVGEALRELRSWKKRYEMYQELASAIEGVGLVIKQLEKAA